MKWNNVKDNLLNKLNLLIFLPEILNRKKKIWISYALPRWKKDNYNWGDDVNSILINLLSSKQVVPYKFSWIKRTHYLCIGSIIQWYSNKNAIIWGSGLLYSTDKIHPPKKVLAVRGPLTRECLLKCGIECPPIYGDPALLFPRFYFPKIEKKYKYGIILHFSELDKMKNIKSKLNDCLFINIKNYGVWSHFIDQILSCEVILSSSLHGIIISDAYSIPNIWCQFSDYTPQQNGFKFKDYFLSVGKNIENPVHFDKLNYTKINLISQCWEKPEIDLDLLMEVCPFKDKRQHLS